MACALPSEDTKGTGPSRLSDSLRQTGNERDVTAEPGELGHGNFTLRLLRRLQLRPPVERVRTLAGFDLGKLREEVDGRGEDSVRDFTLTRTDPAPGRRGDAAGS